MTLWALQWSRWPWPPMVRIACGPREFAPCSVKNGSGGAGARTPNLLFRASSAGRSRRLHRGAAVELSAPCGRRGGRAACSTSAAHRPLAPADGRAWPALLATQVTAQLSSKPCCLQGASPSHPLDSGPNSGLPCRSGRGLAAGDAELATSAAAEAAGVLLSAGRDLQDAAVGLYDSKLSRFSISDTQVRGRW